MAAPTPTTELDAVNEMLTSIGVTPVNTLNVSGLTDAAIALDTLRSTSKEVQSHGWWFNKDVAQQMVPAGGFITVPSTILSVRPSLGTYNQSAETTRFVLRDNKLWDTDLKANVNTTVYADVVKELEFENLPETARRAIYVRAARIFQTKVLGDEQLGVFTEAHEQEAWKALEADEGMSAPESTLFQRRVQATASALRPNPVSSNQMQGRQQGGR